MRKRASASTGQIFIYPVPFLKLLLILWEEKKAVKETLSKWIGRHHSGNESMWRLSILWCQMMMGRRGRRFASAAVTLFQDFLFSACLINCADQKTHWNSTFPSSEKTPFPWKTVYITNEASKKQSPSLSLSRLPAVNSQTNRVLVWDLSWFAVLFLLLSTTQKRFFFLHYFNGSNFL